MSSLKLRIIQNRFLYKNAVFIFNLINYFSNTRCVKGKRNSIDIHSAVMLKTLRLTLLGMIIK